MNVQAHGGPPSSRREWVLHQLRERVASGELPPGTRLVERDLSALYGVSRGPVREALMMLEQEGLLVWHAYRGVEVATVSRQEIVEVLVPIRMVIERAALRAAAAGGREDLLGRLDALVNEMDGALAAADATLLAELDLRFRREIVFAAGRAHSSRIWQTVEPRIRGYFRRDALRDDQRPSIPARRRRLLEVMRTGTADQLEAAIDDHIRTHLDDTTAEPE